MAETSRVFGAWSVPAPEYVIERRVDGLSVLGGRMGHATPGGAGPAAAAPSTGRAAPAGGPAEGRRRAAGAGVGQFGVVVVAVLSSELHLRPMTDSGRRLADRRDGSSCFGCFECFECGRSVRGFARDPCRPGAPVSQADEPYGSLPAYEGQRDRFCDAGSPTPAAQRGRRARRHVRWVLVQGHSFNSPRAMMASARRSGRGHLQPCAVNSCRIRLAS